MKETGTVQSVDRALLILEKLKDTPKGLGVTELSTELHVSKSTAHRLLTSLLKKGFVRQNLENQKYMLGLKLIEFGQTVTDHLDIRSAASGHLRRLAEKVGETAHLVIRERSEIVYIDKIESSATIRMFSNIGKRAPMHCTGVGKAILAFLPYQDIVAIVEEKGLEKFTSKTIIELDALFEHLEMIRNRGYSIDDEEHELGIKCAAAPILNYKGEVIAGISVAGPIMRVSEEKLGEMSREVLKTSKAISMDLGGAI
ncbi:MULTISPECIES: IclR family transcriptional regulator [unclassified Sporosarcina]|uniref:IclR family transcriptional regulator n=1 Tax=unclassified Sporosarcina TaxID=2647733 RepID=UPI00203C7626|nr:MULTISPECIES: IclR family transcriptional regulator [unclassified Sporosarcina]GKV64837.1 IclR family transcriptional regulator [Sporosarcina sp. NCCP-2331]GLB54947.1 IclR family transcriptional regulator [Sporosarcina sp. NCCP-2378]